MTDKIVEQKKTSDSADTLSILKAAADISDWGYGRWVYNKWEEFNTEYFDDQLSPGGIFWGLTPHGKSLGYYERWRNAITLHTSLLKPSSDNAWGIGRLLGERFTSDVLLHEMIHQANNQLDNYNGRESHNCQPWCDQLNRLIPLLGLDTDLIAKPVKQKRVKAPGQKKGSGKAKWIPEPGCMDRKQLAQFPHCFRQKEIRVE